MDEEENALPWKSYRDYYYMSKEDLVSIGTSSCFRVRCKLCAPALKTIGTNRSSSSNLRKHMKCIHPEALEEMEQRSLTEGNGAKGRKKRDDQQEATSKRAKRDDLLGGERELLFQLIEEFTEALECSSGDELGSQKRAMWQSISSTFNEISGGPERTPEQLRNIWENLHDETIGSGEEGTKVGPRIMASCSMKMEKGDTKSYTEEVTWENAVTSDEPEIELVDDISRPIIMTDENVTYTSMEMGYQDESTIRQNGFQQGRDLNSKQSDIRKRSEVELKLREQMVSDHKVRLDGLKQQLDLKKEILREELEHQRRLKKIELVHRKTLNSMERTMKQEAFRGEERRKEEKHAVEMSILRMSARLTPQMRWKTPGMLRCFASTGSKLDSSFSECMRDDTQQQTDGQTSSQSNDKQPKALSMERKIILPQRSRPDKRSEAEQANATMQYVPEQVCIQVNVTDK